MKARYVDINKIAHVIGQDVCKALPGLHAFTVCDAVSAFAGIGKVKPLKKLLSKVEYQRMFQQLGEHWLMSEDLLKQLKAFVCDIYGAKKSISDVNQCRYAVFCAKKGEAESHQLPPCQDSLYKHCRQANYQAAIWKFFTKQRHPISSWPWLVSRERRCSREIGNRLDEWTTGTKSSNRADVMCVQ